MARVGNQWIPQFSDGSGWNVEDYEHFPYFYEHVTRQEAREMKAASAERLYKIVCLQPYDTDRRYRHYHKNTFFVKGAFLAEFLQLPPFTAILAEGIVSIEPVESIPPTDEKLR